MKNWRIDKRIVERKSSDNQEWSEQEIDEFEEEIEDLPDTHRGPCTGIGWSIVIFCYWARSLCLYFIYSYVSVQENAWTSDDDQRSENFFHYVRFESTHILWLIGDKGAHFTIV